MTWRPLDDVVEHVGNLTLRDLAALAHAFGLSVDVRLDDPRAAEAEPSVWDLAA